MATTLSWTDLRRQAIHAFDGELPTDTTENDLIEAFKLEPAAVANLLTDVAADLQTGKARSGWAVWRTRAQAVHARREAHATDDRDREVSVRLAETWIRNSGGYIDREDELLDELFGHTGRLRAWHDDQPLQDRMTRLWEQHRPRFEKTEEEALERARRNIRIRAEIAAKLAAHIAAESTINQTDHADRIAAEVQRARQAANADIDFEAA